MALSVPKPPGVSQMMKDGARVSTNLWKIHEFYECRPVFGGKNGDLFGTSEGRFF